MVTPVAPLHMKGSKIKSPIFEADSMQRSSKASGFCVGCSLNVFSALFGGANVQTTFHLFAVILCFHGFIMKRVFGFFIFLCP